MKTPLLPALLALVLASGCATKPSDTEGVRRTSASRRCWSSSTRRSRTPARAARIKGVLERLGADFDRQAGVLQVAQDRLRTVARKYESTDEQLEAILRDVRAEGVALRELLQDAHFEVHALVTEDEWTRIVNDRRKVLGIF